MSATATAPATAPDRRRADDGTGTGFGDTVASERIKLTTRRSTFWMVLIATVPAVALTGVFCAIIAATWEQQPAAAQQPFSPITFSFIGLIVTGVTLAVFGAKTAATEYSSGMMRLTLTATPRRGRVLLAKALLIALVSWIATAVATVGSFFLGQAVLGGAGLETVGITDGDAARAVGAVIATAPLFPLIGMALAVLLRSSAGAIAAVLGLIFAPSTIGNLLPEWWQTWVIGLMPAAAADSLALGHVNDMPIYRDPPVAAAAVVAWIILSLVVAHLFLQHRDA